MPVGIAPAVVILHHGLLGTLQPTDVFGTPPAQLHRWRWALVHGVFVLAGSGDPTALALVAAVLELSRSLGADVIAEGVETQEQAETLTSLGCPRVQDFLYARPRPACELRPGSQLRPAAAPAPRGTDETLLESAGL